MPSYAMPLLLLTKPPHQAPSLCSMTTLHSFPSQHPHTCFPSAWNALPSSPGGFFPFSKPQPKCHLLREALPAPKPEWPPHCPHAQHLLLFTTMSLLVCLRVYCLSPHVEQTRSHEERNLVSLVIIQDAGPSPPGAQ